MQEAEVDIVDARALAQPPTLEDNGVALVDAALPASLMAANQPDPSSAGGYRSWADDDELVVKAGGRL